MPVSYTLEVTFQDPAVAEEWTEWMRGGHMQALLAHGADRAELVRWSDAETIDDEIRFTARYRFPTRADFDAYIAQHAEELRNDGMKRFPPSRGIVYSRTVGEILLPYEEEA